MPRHGPNPPGRFLRTLVSGLINQFSGRHRRHFRERRLSPPSCTHGCALSQILLVRHFSRTARPNGAVTTTPEVYFAVVGSDEGGLFTLLAGAGDRAGAADLRSAVTARLVAEWPPVMVRAFDDELELAEWAVRQWPNDPAATTIVATITAERRGG